jgi:SAM-dependent methyltransferase
MTNSQKRRENLLTTEQVSCRICGLENPRRLFSERYVLEDAAVDLGINRCRQCSLVYVSPRLTPESTRLVYELDRDETISNNYCWDGSASEGRFAPLLRRLKTTASPGKLLDVGCGAGQFLHAAKKSGPWQVIGVEPVASAAEQARRYAGCEVHCSTLESAHFAPHSFSVAALLGVLEHLHEPVETLRHVRRLLKSDGVLAIYVPNFNYLRWKDAGPLCYARTRRWSKLHPQEHLFHFTAGTLRRTLEACGFDVLRIDIGRPFTPAHKLKWVIKEAAYWASCGVKTATGIHAGALEVIARANPKHLDESGLPTWKRSA